MSSTETLPRCSFCGKDQSNVRKLIAGRGVCICDECVDVCLDIIAEEAEETDKEAPRPV